MGNIKEKAKELFEVAAEPGIELVSEMFLEGVVGSVVPGVSNAVLSYRQKRQEKMFIEFMEETRNRAIELEASIKQLSKENQIIAMNNLFQVVSDNVLNEVEVEKIKYYVNGFINTSKKENLNYNDYLINFDCMNELRVIDLKVLEFQTNIIIGKSYSAFIENEGINDEQYRIIIEKLLRLGLLINRREEKEDDLYSNLESIQNFLTDITKDKKNVKLKRLKNLERKGRKVSQFGRRIIADFLT